MKHGTRLGIYFLLLCIGLLLGAVAGIEGIRRGAVSNAARFVGIVPHGDTLPPILPLVAPPMVREEAAQRIESSRRNGIVAATRAVEPCVVGIVVTQIQVVGSSYYYEDFFDLFNEPRQVPRYREVQNMGSGFVIDTSGLILTNFHVVDGARKLYINFPDGSQVEGEVVGVDQFSDVAVVAVSKPKKRYQAVRFGNSSDLMIGEWAIAIGNPFLNFFNDAQPTVTVGVVSALHRNFAPSDNVYYQDMIQTDAAINPGNSGGPLCNAVGEVIGINAFIYTGSRRDKGSIGIGFAIPISIARRVAQELIDHGRRRQVWTGIAVQDFDRTSAHAIGRGDLSGVIITGVAPSSPGERAGLKSGDIILRMGARRIGAHTDLDGFFLGYFPGDTVSMVVKRAGRDVALTLVLKEMPRS